MTGNFSAPWLSNMNEEQAEVIAHNDGPCLVAAGAGSGKTRALVNRIGRLVCEGGVSPERILAVTFTSKAAEEMRDRLARDLGVSDVRACTWHSFCLTVLRDDKTRWATYEVDEKDRYRGIIKEVCGYKHLDWKGADCTLIGRFIAHCKANLAAPDTKESEQIAKKIFAGKARDAVLAGRAYALAETLSDERGLLPFDDFLVRCVEHFRDNEDRREAWGQRFDYVLQDEAQDANVAQIVLGEMLSREHRNYMVIGDPSQAIYGFRGSSPAHLMAFPDVWKARTICLHRNYRCGSKIVDIANTIVAEGEVKMPHPLTAARGAVGEILVKRTHDFDDEARSFVDWVKDNKEDGTPYGNLTCLFRTNAQSRALEEALLSEKIPYQIVGAESFYERKEIKDLLAYIRVALGRDAEGDSVRRCINAPFRFLGAKFVESLMEAASTQGGPWTSLVQQTARKTGIQARQVVSATTWVSLIEGIASKDQERDHSGVRVWSAGAIIKDLVYQTGYIDWLTKEEGEESVENSRASNVRELMRVADRFESVGELLDFVEKNLTESKKERRKQTGDRVLLMSIHRAKGLEWPKVWVVGCNEGILPHARGDREEERRLTYVALTRAKDELVVSYVDQFATPKGIVKGVPSQFLVSAGLIQDQ